MSSNLKPCPFCGGSAEETSRFDVRCLGCGAEINAAPGFAVQSWNRRADSAALDAAVQAEREACIEVIETIDVRPDSRADEALIAAADAIRSRGPAPAVDEPTIYTHPRGVWRCECCGEMYDGVSTDWRMMVGKPEHKCPGNDPQCGYFTARFFGDAPAVDVLAVVREFVEAEAAWNGKDDSIQRLVKAFDALRALVSPATGEGKDGGAKG